MFKKVCQLLIFILLFFAKNTFCMMLPESIESIERNVVQLASYMVDDRTKVIQSFPEGSGFLVGKDGYVITAIHVLDSISAKLNGMTVNKKGAWVNVAIPPGEDANHNIEFGNFIALDYDVVDRDETHDIALLKLRTNPFSKEFLKQSQPIGFTRTDVGTQVKFNTHRPKDGTAIAISGYPLDQPALVTNAGYVATAWSSYRTKNGSDEFHSYLGDIQVNPGNSGGPVYLIDDGSLIGICIAFKGAPVPQPNQGLILANSGLTVIIPSEYIVKILKKNTVQFEVE